MTTPHASVTGGAHDLPQSLFTGAHTRLALAAAGISARELRGPLWEQSNRGLWACAAGGPASPDDRIRRAVPLLRGGGVIGGWAAARLLGGEWFDGEDALGGPQPVLICLPPDARCRRTRDVRVFRSRLTAEETAMAGDVPVTGPLRTCVDLARLATSVTEAVVVLDAARSALSVPAAEVAAWLQGHPRWRGVAQARRAVHLSRDGVKSAQESRLRLLWTQTARLPEPMVNVRVLTRDGRLLCEADLLEPASGLVAEFDGAHHAAAPQREIDHARRESMRRAGLTVVVVTAAGLTTQRRRTVIRLVEAHRAAKARDRRLDMWYLPRVG